MSLINNFLTENIFTIGSEQELAEAFRERDQAKLLVPAGLEYPINIRSYFTWKEPSGVYTYLIYKMPNWDMPKGVAFKRTAPSGEQTGGLCNWCHAYGSSDEIGLLSVTMNSNVSMSYFLCHDLRCIEKIEEAAARSGKSPEKQIDELYFRMGKLFENISSYKPD